jgi:hypothetical protein
MIRKLRFNWKEVIMNARCAYKAGISLFVVILPVILSGQTKDAKFAIAPYIKGLANIKDGFLEAGPVFYNQELEIHPYIRLPITDKERSLAQIDRSTNSLNFGASLGYIRDLTEVCDTVRRFYLVGQLEGGTRQYVFFPDSTTSSEKKMYEWYFSGELKAGYFWSAGKCYASQWNPEFRIRYARNVSEAEKTGIVRDHPNGISSVENMIISRPEIRSSFSPAVAISYYPGKGKFSYTPAVYFYFTGKEDESNPFNHVSRLRVETWIYYYPVMTGNFMKIGLSPFLSARTSGDDSEEKLLYGILVQLLVDKNLLRFL